MAAKFIQSLTDDNPDLQKQIGCMTGIFQVFDLQHMLTPRRISSGNSLKQRPTGDLRCNDTALETDSNTVYGGSMPIEKPSHGHVLEKQRISTESSRASFSSSSRSSSFSSLDHNKNAQPVASPCDLLTFPENPSRDTGMSQSSVSSQLCRPSFDLRQVVKDSMYRESQGLPAKTTATDEAVNSLVKQRDLPQPLSLSIGSNETYDLGFSAKAGLPIDLKESVTFLAKLQEAPWLVNEPRELSRSVSYHSKDGSFFSIMKEAPRFSYDGKDARHALYESRENAKSSLKPPRLSLDNRERSMKSLKSEPQSDLFLKPSQNDSINSNHLLNQRQTSGAQTRPPSVVAKLMGLEAMPASNSSSETSTVEDSGFFSRTSNTAEPFRPIQIATPSKTLWREPTSPRYSSITPASRFPMEPAPWKQVDGHQTSPVAASKGMRAPVRNSNTLPMAFSEVEKRLKDLKFSQSGKDLRALKQILEAMKAKGLLESQQGENTYFATTRDLGKSTNSTPLNDSQKPQNDQVYVSTTRGTNFSRNHESPIVIMKPAKLVQRSGIPTASVISPDELSNLPRIQGDAFIVSRSSANSRASRGQVPKSSSVIVSNDIKSNNRTSRTKQTAARSSQIANEGLLKTSESISPRMHQKKAELEKRSKPPIPPTGSGRSRRTSNMQGTDSSSQGVRRRSNASVIKQSDDQLSDTSNELRQLSCCQNDYSVQSDGSILSESPMDIEVNSRERSPEQSYCQSPSMKIANKSVSCSIEKKSNLLCHEDELPMEHPVVDLEYPSPVSVLDSLPNVDDSPSPVKHKLMTTRDGKSPEFGGVPCSEPHNSGIGFSINAFSSVPTSEINRKKLQKIETLVQKLQRLNSSHDEAQTDYIASLCENTNPDHRYISEILLASGFLLSDLDSSLTNFQLHPSGHPINPELFLVLEQTKASAYSKHECASERMVELRLKQKVHRKLIFDTINEVLASKLASLVLSSLPLWRPHKLARKNVNAQKLLRELCLETEELQSKKSKCSSEHEDDALTSTPFEDVMHQSESWRDYSNDVSGIVLDIERLVFKDLVSEVVIGEGTGLENKLVMRRQLFEK